MAMTVAELAVKVGAEGVGNTITGLETVNKGILHTGSHFSDILPKLALASFVAIGAAAVGAGIVVVKAMDDLIQEGIAANLVLAQTQAVLTSTKGVAGVTAAAVSTLTDKFMNLTGINDDTVRSTENLLLTFTSIGKDIFPQATAAVLDMSVALGEDTKNAAIQLGKALQDPAIGMTALRRVGVEFDKTQRDLIKTYMAHGEQGKAQALILAELNKEFGGSAEKAGLANGGIKILGAQFDDLKKTTGQLLLTALVPLATDVLPYVRVVLGWVADAAKGLPALFDSLGKVLAPVASGFGDIADAAKGLPDLFRRMGDFLSPLMDSYTRVDLPMVSFGKHMGDTSTVLERHKGILSQVGDVAGVVGGFLKDKLGGAFEALRPTLEHARDAVGQFVSDLGNKLGPALINVGHFLSLLQGIWNAAWPAMSAVLMGVWDIIKGIVQIAWSIVSGIIKIGLDLLGGNWKAAWTDLGDMLGGIWAGINKILDGALKIMAGAVLAAVSAILSLFAKIPGPIGDAAKAALTAVQGIAAQMRAAGEDAGNKYAAGLGSRAAAVAGAAANLAAAGVPTGGGGRQAHASGGLTWPGVSLVGEQGPELAIFPTGTRIIPAAQTAALMGGSGNGSGGSSGGGGFSTANIYVMLDGQVLSRQLAQPLVDHIRVHTGLRI